MTKVAEVMTRNPETISPSEPVRKAAEMMDRLNVGALPVCDGNRLTGMVTDRDIVVRAVAAGMESSCAVQDVLSAPVQWCCEDDDVSEVQAKMADTQIRRLPVVDSEKRLVGILSLGDLATSADGGISSTLGAVSAPSQPDR
jgi:CBS domain-containing protein